MVSCNHSLAHNYHNEDESRRKRKKNRRNLVFKCLVCTRWIKRLHTVSHNSRELKTVTDNRAKIWSARVLHFQTKNIPLLLYNNHVFKFLVSIQPEKIKYHWLTKHIQDIFFHKRNLSLFNTNKLLWIISSAFLTIWSSNPNSIIVTWNKRVCLLLVTKVCFLVS